MKENKVAKDLLLGYEIVKFSINDLGLHPLIYKKKYSKRKDYNDQAFVNWLTDVLKARGGNNACAISFSKNNDAYLFKNINSMTYLNYSPTVDESLSDDEYKINLNELVNTI